jgi:hypothetical protein
VPFSSMAGSAPLSPADDNMSPCAWGGPRSHWRRSPCRRRSGSGTARRGHGVQCKRGVDRGGRLIAVIRVSRELIT